MAKKKSKNSIRYPSQDRSRATVEAILEATAQILVKEGHSKISTNAIAKRAGVSIGGLYQYFANREEILKEICLRERMADFEALQAVLEQNKGMSIDKAIQDILTVSLARFSDQPLLRRILDSEVHYRGKDPQMKQIRKQLAIMLAARLRDLGYKRLPEDIEKQFEVLIAGFEGSYYAALEIYQGDLDQKDFVANAGQMIMAYLGRL